MPRRPSAAISPTTVRHRALMLGLTIDDLTPMLDGRVTDDELGEVMLDRLDPGHPAAVAVRDAVGLDDQGMPVADVGAMLAARVYAGEVALDLDDQGRQWLDRLDRWGQDPLTVLGLASKLGAMLSRTVEVRAPAGHLLDSGSAAGVVWGGCVAAAAYDPTVAMLDRDLICYTPDPAALVKRIRSTAERWDGARLATMRIGQLEPWVGPAVDLGDGRRVTGRLQTVIDCLATRDGASHAMRLLERAGV